MPCCGKKLVEQSVNIVKGFSALSVGKKYEFTDARLAVCRTCEKGYFKKEKYLRLFCAECKCFIPAKARVQYELCPLNKWPDRAGVQKEDLTAV
jgi:hypothetical protein